MKNYGTMYFIGQRIYESRINKIISMIMYRINDGQVVQAIMKNNTIGVFCNHTHPPTIKYYYYVKWRNYEI